MPKLLKIACQAENLAFTASKSMDYYTSLKTKIPIAYYKCYFAI